MYLYAQIKLENIKSKKSFEKLGFKLVKTNKVFSEYCLNLNNYKM